MEISKFGEKILRDGKIIGNEETPLSMIDRITNGIRGVEEGFGGEDIDGFVSDLQKYIGIGKIVPNTAIMTNLGRYIDKPLSACTVPDIDLRSDFSKIKKQVDDIHLGGMGTGFNLDDLDNPIEVLRFLNKIGVELQESGEQDRPVGNMGIMSIYNEHIEEFIELKVLADQKGEKWNFNLSVSLDSNFMEAVKNNGYIVLTNGRQVLANEIFDKIAQSAHLCADPGILFMDRMQEGNTTPNIGEYVSVAPCGETGLTKGETCNFGSLDLAEFITSENEIDYDHLEEVIFTLVRYLDDIVEYNLDKYSDESSKYVMEQKRKIGIGVCGIADLFIKLGLEYGSVESIELSEDIMSFINLKSKQASIELSKKRGRFKDFDNSLYVDDYVSRNYGQYATNKVSIEDWETLNSDIKTFGLRNSNTVIVPPTGRSALVFGASQQIEPLFSLVGLNGALYRGLQDIVLPNDIQDKVLETGSLQGVVKAAVSDLLDIEVYKIAKEISLQAHLDILDAFSKFTDDAVSKTVNLPNDASIGDIKRVYINCYDRGLKGITIYRDGSKLHQPMKMGK